jgi:GNAT superfamily N-acetyltransferase
MIAACSTEDLPRMSEIINESAMAYKGVIPADRWHEPYMPLAELRSEIAQGVCFHGYWQQGLLVGVMGVQEVQDVTLIRHAYISTPWRGHGIGRLLLGQLTGACTRRILIGAWKDAVWAVRFYQNNGFRLTEPAEKDRLLKTYWTVPERQIEESVVLSST